MTSDMPRRILRAAGLYFVVLFAFGAVLGTLRMLLLVPHLGELTAVALELPVMLALSWLVAGRIRQSRGGLHQRRALLAMGGVALALLIAAEMLLGVVAFGQPLAGFAAALVGPSGLLGLAGQLIFALIPAIEGRKT